MLPDSIVWLLAKIQLNARFLYTEQMFRTSWLVVLFQIRTRFDDHLLLQGESKGTRVVHCPSWSARVGIFAHLGTDLQFLARIHIMTG